jgi:hypothetical protein
MRDVEGLGVELHMRAVVSLSGYFLSFSLSLSPPPPSLSLLSLCFSLWTRIHGQVDRNARQMWKYEEEFGGDPSLSVGADAAPLGSLD